MVLSFRQPLPLTQDGCDGQTDGQTDGQKKNFQTIAVTLRLCFAARVNYGSIASVDYIVSWACAHSRVYKCMEWNQHTITVMIAT